MAMMYLDTVFKLASQYISGQWERIICVQYESDPDLVPDPNLQPVSWV